MSSPPSSGRILLLLFVGVLMAALDIAVVGPALTAIRTHFGLDERNAAWVFNTFVLLNLLGVPVLARLSDTWGRRRAYMLAVGLFGLGSLVVALSPSFPVLLLGRGLQGLAAAGIFPVASAVVGDTFAPERRGRALGMLGAVFGLAFTIGPILAGVFLATVGWKWLFVLNLPLALLVLFFSACLLPDARASTPRPLDLPGMALLGLMLVSLAYGITLLDTHALRESLANPRIWLALAVTAVAFPLFLRAERRAEDPLLRLSLLTNRQVTLASLLAFGAGLAEAAFIFFPALAVVAFAVSSSTASFMLLPLVLSVAFGSPLAGRLLDRFGSKAIVFTSSSVLTLGMACIGLLAPTSGGFYLGSILIGLGLAGLLGPSLSYILLHEARAGERTISQGIITLFLSIGQTLGSALIGAVAASGAGRPQDYQRAFLVIAGIGFVLTLLSLGLKSRAAEQQSIR